MSVVLIKAITMLCRNWR